jgi:hypothetical protein
MSTIFSYSINNSDYSTQCNVNKYTKADKPANKTKENLNSDGQLFTNINKTKESLNREWYLCV